MYRAHKVHSILSRKRGCLERLHEREYIDLKGVRWEVNFPKGDAILIEKPEIISELNPYYYIRTLAPKLATHLRDLKAHTEGRLNKVPILYKKPSKRATEKLHKETAAKLKGYVKESIDLDKITNKTLSTLVAAKVWLGILKHARESIFQ
ncbi:unnamed protein product, partial [marine sediment metagenome]